MTQPRQRKFFLHIPPEKPLDASPEQEREWIVQWVEKIKKYEQLAIEANRYKEFKQELVKLEGCEPTIYTLFTMGEGFEQYL